MNASGLWPHVIMDDFLDPEDFAVLSSHPKDHVAAGKVLSIFNNQVFADGRVVAENLSKELLVRIHSRCHPKMYKLLQELAPNKVHLYEYSDYELVITGSKCPFPVHDDIPSKLLSIVVYLSPEHNTGALLYDNREGRNPHEVPWKQNRALIFSRREQVTWHAYKGDGKNNRLALVYNLMTHDNAGVFKAEGRSHLAHKLRKQVNKATRKIGKLAGRA